MVFIDLTGLGWVGRILVGLIRFHFNVNKKLYEH